MIILNQIYIINCTMLDTHSTFPGQLWKYGISRLADQPIFSTEQMADNGKPYTDPHPSFGQEQVKVAGSDSHQQRRRLPWKIPTVLTTLHTVKLEFLDPLFTDIAVSSVFWPNVTETYQVWQTWQEYKVVKNNLIHSLLKDIYIYIYYRIYIYIFFSIVKLVF